MQKNCEIKFVFIPKYQRIKKINRLSIHVLLYILKYEQVADIFNIFISI